jgi:NAD(P)-dependent dehydrogenase (short-subunit alcohol dehydrogenase family)
MSKPLAGRAALITGASQGLGLAIARSYVERGAEIVICARDMDALHAAEGELSAVAGAQRIIAYSADVSDPDSVRALVSTATQALPHLSILVNNAGIQGPTGSVETNDWSEWVRAIEINLFGSVLTTRALIPHLRATGGGKIIQISGGGATSPMTGLSAYAASKAAVVRFAETLALELKPDHVDVNAIAPGALNTRMLEEVLAAGPEKVGAAYYERAVAQQCTGGTPLRKGADLAVWLASSASDGITGKLLSAVWDPWVQLPEHRDDLGSDIYTLRRIVPADRGCDWGR